MIYSVLSVCVCVCSCEGLLKWHVSTFDHYSPALMVFLWPWQRQEINVTSWNLWFMCIVCVCVFFFFFISIISVVRAWTYIIIKALWWLGVFMTLAFVCCHFAGVWHRQLNAARVTSTSCRKRSRRSGRGRRSCGRGGRSSDELSRDLHVSPLSQAAIQRGEAAFHLVWLPLFPS